MEEPRDQETASPNGALSALVPARPEARGALDFSVTCKCLQVAGCTQQKNRNRRAVQMLASQSRPLTPGPETGGRCLSDGLGPLQRARSVVKAILRPARATEPAARKGPAHLAAAGAAQEGTRAGGVRPSGSACRAALPSPCQHARAVTSLWRCWEACEDA